ncbi:D-alanyl-D-alanine carboxypeptidase [Pseudovibrio exalbescens]|uniref:D-alanyl-D-alanine carboxypeptidase family protein n=1 Tax=Pseudovibrio exalbescens TaxID=197461 RepID=UPI002365A833|nr:D-alanyl-D-alanine carboxypeptidase family protein [Pseudovibrio exalbescens]MDD7908822.1 D-alanyl-D-alanine carboxypeptidase [Pseudovibrio exalbescens]
MMSLTATQAVELNSTSAFLYDADRNALVYSKNAQTPFAPANLTKLMTALVVLDAIRAEQVAASTELPISEDAWRRGGAPARVTTMFANVRSSVSVENLLKGLVVHSANDAAIALAQGIAGDETAFAQRMTEKAQELGMTNTTYANATGYPDPNNTTTLADQLKLVLHIIKEEPELHGLFGVHRFTWNNITQRNKNPLLREIEGLDGFTAGFAETSGYSGIGTLLVHGNRYVAAVAGARNEEERLEDLKTLLVSTFSGLSIRPVFLKGEEVARARVYGGKQPTVALVTPGALHALLDISKKEEYGLRVVYDGPLPAPVQAGKQVGELQLLAEDTVIFTSPLITGESVQKGTLQQRSMDAIAELFWKLF